MGGALQPVPHSAVRVEEGIAPEQAVPLQLRLLEAVGKLVLGFVCGRDAQDEPEAPPLVHIKVEIVFPTIPRSRVPGGDFPS